MSVFGRLDVDTTVVADKLTLAGILLDMEPTGENGMDVRLLTGKLDDVDCGEVDMLVFLLESARPDKAYDVCLTDDKSAIRVTCWKR